jgi:putative tricarboxylic transport membrane protein
MRSSDLATGLLLLTGGLAVAAYAQTFPPMPGQSIGPSLFPTIIGVGLALVGGVLAVSGLKRRDTPWLEIEAWARTPRAVGRVALVIIVLIAYTVVVDPLGFLITGVLFLSVLLAAFGARRAWIVPLAIGVTVAIHYGFYTVIGVPLPWGVLEAIAW